MKIYKIAPGYKSVKVFRSRADGSLLSIGRCIPDPELPRKRKYDVVYDFLRQEECGPLPAYKETKKETKLRIKNLRKGPKFACKV